jgi:hypothetical protein
MFENKESAGYKPALRFLAETEKDTLPDILIEDLGPWTGNDCEHFSDSIQSSELG